VAKAQSAPIEEMQECAWACANWLLKQGFFANPFEDGEGPTLLPPDVICRLSDHINDDGAERARVVRELLMWLDYEVLPAIDGRREASRLLSRSSGPPKSGTDPSERADLIYGDADEEQLAERVRKMVTAQIALKTRIQKVVNRQAERAKLARQLPPIQLAQTYQLWLDSGEAVHRLLISPVSTKRRIPRTPRDWANARSAFEADFKEVGFSAKEILELIPKGGTKEALKARNRRARKRTQR
jgi:hypothetical protein